MDNMEILTAIIAIETFVIIILTIILLRKRSGGIEPTTADLFKEILKKVPTADTSEEDYSELVEKKADEEFEEIRKEMSEKMKAEITEISRKTRKTDAQIEKLQKSMEKLLNEAITESRHVERNTVLETLEGRILILLLKLAPGEYMKEGGLWEEKRKASELSMRHARTGKDSQRLQRGI